MKFIRHLTAGVFFPAIISILFLAGCGGGGLLADGGIIGTGSITGTVPGTIIEAYGDQGQYFQVFSENNNTDEHPFLLKLPAGVGFYLVMIINEDTENEIVMPIAFPGNKQGEILARITLHEGEVINLGHISLYMDCANVPLESDPDNDCILDKPYILNEDQGAKNPLRQMDADDDGIDDYEDEDHGYGPQNGSQFKDPQDLDDDRVPNFYDDDFNPGSNDKDEDGIDDDEDENPVNWKGKGMHPSGQTWREHHGEYAEQNLENCASCHGDDFLGTPLSGQIGCYGCHDGPNFEDDESDEDLPLNWNGAGMHPVSQIWVDEHGEYAEHNYNGCTACHGADLMGSPLSALARERNFLVEEDQGQRQFRAGHQIGCYDCHNGPSPEDD